jgi:hypothetical protein
MHFLDNTIGELKSLPDQNQAGYVGVAGFEPATPWSQTRCANRAALHPDGDSGRGRTFNLLLRRQLLYPLSYGAVTDKKALSHTGLCGEGGIRTPGTVLPVRQFSKLLV